jgi:hypothetical protein
VSVVRSFSIFCDGDEAPGHPCPHWFGDVTDSSYRSPVREVRRQATGAGWTRRKVGDRMLDLCPLGTHYWSGGDGDPK